jgi:hypothetical protein
MLKRRDYAIIALGVIGALLIVAAIINQLIVKSINESYSPGFHSESVADSRRRGVFLAPVRIDGTDVEVDGIRYRATEAWVEDQLQIRYRLLFFRRDSLLDQPTLVVRIEPDSTGVEPLCVALRSREIRYDGHNAFTASDCRSWFASVELPFPESIALSVSERRR